MTDVRDLDRQWLIGHPDVAQFGRPAIACCDGVLWNGPGRRPELPARGRCGHTAMFAVAVYRLGDEGHRSRVPIEVCPHGCVGPIPRRWFAFDGIDPDVAGELAVLGPVIEVRHHGVPSHLVEATPRALRHMIDLDPAGAAREWERLADRNE